jgi:hypothetical protein
LRFENRTRECGPRSGRFSIAGQTCLFKAILCSSHVFPKPENEISFGDMSRVYIIHQNLQIRITVGVIDVLNNLKTYFYKWLTSRVCMFPFTTFIKMHFTTDGNDASLPDCILSFRMRNGLRKLEWQ